MSDGWISKSLAAERLGISQGTIRGYIEQKWQRGYHFQVKGRVTFVHYGRVQEWIGSPEGSRGKLTASALESISKAGRPSIKRSSATPIPLLS